MGSRPSAFYRVSGKKTLSDYQAITRRSYLQSKGEFREKSTQCHW